MLLATGASSNFASLRLLQHLGITYHSAIATLRLADGASSPILTRVRLKFKLLSPTCTFTCYVTLCKDFELMISHKAVLGCSNFAASSRSYGKLCTLTPRSILTDKGKLLSQLPESGIGTFSKSLPPKDKVTRHDNRADQHFQYSECYEVLDPKSVQGVPVADWPTPSCSCEVLQFLGLTNFFIEFVQGYADLTKPLTDSSKKDAQTDWTPSCKSAFNALKHALTTAPVLFGFSKP